MNVVGQESAINDLAKEILPVLGYERRGLIIRSRYNIPLQTCGDPNRSARTAVSLIQFPSTILLVVQEDAASVCDPEPQVIAEAIAAFQFNNRTRARLGQPELDSMTIPCTTIIDTRPIFHLIPVAREENSAKLLLQHDIHPLHWSRNALWHLTTVI
jgi:hypothetical protein